MIEYNYYIFWLPTRQFYYFKRCSNCYTYNQVWKSLCCDVFLKLFSELKQKYVSHNVLRFNIQHTDVYDLSRKEWGIFFDWIKCIFLYFRMFEDIIWSNHTNPVRTGIKYTRFKPVFYGNKLPTNRKNSQTH